MNIQAALEYGYAVLQHIPGYRLESELLLAQTLRVTRTHVHAHRDQLLTPAAMQRFKQLCARRLQGEPTAYLLGVKEFWSLELEVNTHTLVPRPETETLVQAALDILPANRKLTLADLGVGSGAVAIAVAVERPNWQVYGVDISVAALEVAGRNISRHSLSNVILLQSDWFANLASYRFDAIISNPPYVAEGDPHLPSLAYEPYSALVAGKDGLEALRLIIGQARSYLNKNGMLLLEHGYDQADAVSVLMHSAGFVTVKHYADLNGIIRVTSGGDHV